MEKTTNKLSEEQTAIDYQKVLELYNETLAGERFFPCHVLTDRRKEGIDEFVKRYGEEQFRTFFERIKQSVIGHGKKLTLSHILDCGIPGYIMAWAPTREVAKKRLADFMEEAGQWEIERLLHIARIYWRGLTFLPLSNWKEIFGSHYMNMVRFERNRRTLELDSIIVDGTKYKLVKEY